MLFMHIIIKMPAPLILSVNNRYTGLIRANIRYGKNGLMEKMEDGYYLNRKESRYLLPRTVDS